MNTVGFLLAAGLGERMRPLTRFRAKASLPVLNLPLFAHGFYSLLKWGCSKVIINLHSHPESILSLLPETRPEGLEVEVSREAVLLGTAGGIKKMEEALSGGPFWILNGDSLLDLDSEAMLRRHRSSGALATLALRPHREGSGYSPVEIGPRGEILRIAGKPEGARRGLPHTFLGVQLVEPDLLRRIPTGRPCGMTSEVYPRLLQEGAPLRGFVTGGFWVEIGTPAAYMAANLDLLSRGRMPPTNTYRNPLPGLFREEEAEMSGVDRRGPVLIGRGGSLGRGVILEDGVIIGQGVSIGEGARIRRSVLWEEARIGPRASLDGCLVGGIRIGEGQILERRALLAPEGGEIHPGDDETDLDPQ